jgi:hypothetical protein
MAERRRQGLCFNCDEPYVHRHVCPRLFLEADDYIDDELLAPEAAAVQQPEDAAILEDPAATNALVVSLHAVAGICADNTMQVPVLIKGERFLTLLDSAMRRLGLTASGGEQLRVTVANGDRLPGEGIARQVPMTVGADTFAMTCVGLDPAASTSSLGWTFFGPWAPSCGTSRP